jgi:hypothetical protein
MYNRSPTDSGGRAIQVVGLEPFDSWEQGFEHSEGKESLLSRLFCVL